MSSVTILKQYWVRLLSHSEQEAVMLWLSYCQAEWHYKNGIITSQRAFFSFRKKKKLKMIANLTQRCQQVTCSIIYFACVRITEAHANWMELKIVTVYKTKMYNIIHCKNISINKKQLTVLIWRNFACCCFCFFRCFACIFNILNLKLPEM